MPAAFVRPLLPGSSLAAGATRLRENAASAAAAAAVTAGVQADSGWPFVYTGRPSSVYSRRSLPATRRSKDPETWTLIDFEREETCGEQRCGSGGDGGGGCGGAVSCTAASSSTSAPSSMSDTARRPASLPRTAWDARARSPHGRATATDRDSSPGHRPTRSPTPSDFPRTPEKGYEGSRVGRCSVSGNDVVDETPPKTQRHGCDSYGFSNMREFTFSASSPSKGKHGANNGGGCGGALSGGYDNCHSGYNGVHGVNGGYAVLGGSRTCRLQWWTTDSVNMQPSRRKPTGRSASMGGVSVRDDMAPLRRLSEGLGIPPAAAIACSARSPGSAVVPPEVKEDAVAGLGPPPESPPLRATKTSSWDFSVAGPRLGTAAALKISEEMPPSCRNALLFLRNVPSIPSTSPRTMRPFLPARKPEAPLWTLVLDLDETLVHCNRGRGGAVEAARASTADMFVEFDDMPPLGGVHFRPFVNVFLEVAARSFELVIFTASQKRYADKVIDALDPTGAFISYRLYRQHCTEFRGAFFKELELLGRPLSECILVDNSPISLACNPDNGVLIKSWYGDQKDEELPQLLQVLKDLQCAGPGNVCRFLAHRYGLLEFMLALRGVARRRA
eukprot:TRINITY_DN24497_c0_g1_i8.p1 TRINITY_DN24497_c0_g1~~TRINITY_DN24497_c0_g1_i8.p1  ORF type:complete len:690 (+),score=118.34 TRINITY_DN24497_c0_g1_i8:225-2072(+)